MENSKVLGIPIVEGLTNAADLPHTISLAVTYRTRLNSFNELPKDKRPPRHLWDKPTRLSEFFDDIFGDKKKNKSTTYLDYEYEDVE